MQELILIVDNDPTQLHIKEHTLQQKLHYRTLCASSESAAGKVLDPHQRPELMLLDLDTTGEAGLEVIRKVKESHPEFPIIVFARYGDDEDAFKAIHAGAQDCLHKPVTIERLRLALQNAMKTRRMSNYIAWLERKVAGHVDFSDIVGSSEVLSRALGFGREAAIAKGPVWIEGEEGTGRELLARAIHGGSDRAGKPFVAVSCDMLPEHLATSILFGQEKQLAPGNSSYLTGKIREADHGTLLLKEVEALPADVQDRLLRLIETGTIVPVGRQTAMPVSVRLICASTRGSEAYSSGGLNQRLLLHLRQRVIALPPLRQRKGDLAQLADHFIALYAASENKYIRGATERALQWIANHPWPGNVGQLAHTLWRAILISETNQIDVNDLQLVQKSKPIYLGDLPRSVIAEAGAMLLDEKGQVRTLKSVEEEAIRFALHHTGGCMTRAARSLGIGRSTLYRKVGELESNGHISRANQTTRPMIEVSSGERS